MTFAYTITVNDPNHVADDAVLTTNLKAAVDAWGVYLKGGGVIDISLSIAAASSSAELGEGGSDTAVGTGQDGARTIYQAGAANELSTGQDANGATADGEISLNATNLASLYFSATPGGGTTVKGKYDGLSILEHELGHIFGIDGFRDSSGVLPSDSESTWDQLVKVVSRSSATFTGAEATAVYGGPVPVTTTYDSGEAYYHFANRLSDAASNDLMTGTGLPTATIRTISPLDVATMADIGTPLSSIGSLDLAAAILLRLKSFADLPAAAVSAVSTLAGQADAGVSLAAAEAALIPLATASTSVATTVYEFFTQKVPTLAGLDFLVSPEGTNKTNLDSAYYAAFGSENRYINFAVAIGGGGAGAAAFSAAAGSLSLSQVVTNAYAEIFGTTPSADKVGSILNDPVPNGLGGTESRAQYFAYYGQTDLGTKAAAVGFLLSQAVQGDTGVYAAANDALLVKLIGASITPLGTDIVATHSWIA